MATSEFTTGNRNCVAACFHRNRSYRYCRMQLSGNCIGVDHGYGLQMIYGHLSQIAVHEGDMVNYAKSWARVARREWPEATTSTSPCRSMASRSTRRNGGTASASRIELRT